MEEVEELLFRCTVFEDDKTGDVREDGFEGHFMTSSFSSGMSKSAAMSCSGIGK